MEAHLCLSTNRSDTETPQNTSSAVTESLGTLVMCAPSHWLCGKVSNMGAGGQGSLHLSTDSSDTETPQNQ